MTATPTASGNADHALKLVIDTNVVLDWLVFRDPGVADLQRAVSERRVQLVTHQPALDELRRVLAYPQCKLQLSEQQQRVELYQSATESAELPGGFSLNNLLLPPGFPLCRDPDDQHFLALAYHVRADGLITKDKDLLRMRRRAHKFGVTVLSPLQLQSTLRSP